jgi:hypothetical protein
MTRAPALEAIAPRDGRYAHEEIAVTILGE